MALMKLEGEIIVSSSITVGVFAGSTINLGPGRYFLNTIGSNGATRSLCNELVNLLQIGPGGTWTVTVDDNTDTSTGKVTIAHNAVNFTATWSSTTIRDLLGFTGNLSTGGTSSFTGTQQAKYLFLPNVGRSGVMSPDASDGAIETDFTLSLSPDGTPYTLAYSKRYVDSLEMRMLKGSKTWISKESTTHESLEQFFSDVISLGLRIRFHSDRSSDSTFRTWVVDDATSYAPKTVKEDWSESSESLWNVRYIVRKTS